MRGKEVGSALPRNVTGRLKKMGEAEVLVGIPSYNCAHTINYVIHQSAKGLVNHLKGLRGVILVSDGGSTDGTIPVAEALSVPRGVELISTVYKGVPGKGSALKEIFEASKILRAKAILLFDSDLRSITASWVKWMATPILEGYHFVAPNYQRHKYDGTITNQVCYPFTSAVYGVRLRQPIGGDFALSPTLVEKLLESPLWKTPYIPRFGIDIFETHTAIAKKLMVGEVKLGLKLHEAKDPALHLGGMFREVVGSMFSCAIEYQRYWSGVKGVKTAPNLQGCIEMGSPEPVKADPDLSIKSFKDGYIKMRGLLKKLLPLPLIERLELIQGLKFKDFTFEVDLWAEILYYLASAFNREKVEVEKNRLLEAGRVLWTGRVGGFLLEAQDLSDEEVEEKILEETKVFEEKRGILVDAF